MKKPIVILLFTLLCVNITSVYAQPLWDLARKNKDVLVITTLFPAQSVRDNLTSASGLDDAVSWCKQTGITKVYIETFRDGYMAEKETLLRAKKRFLEEGFKVSGCVTPTKFGKNGIGPWTSACYTNKGTQEELQKIFEYTAGMFDEIMIDDFLFTECTCEDCMAACGDQSWPKFYSDLMVKMSRERILKPAKDVNPNAKIIIKYPLWYDDFHKRGYEVVRQSQDFDLIYVGTETRDYNYDVRSSGDVQYNAYFIMRWLGDIGGYKTGGGWFDALGVTPKFYLEQARQTVLGDAKEIMLFCYSNLIRERNKYNGWEGTAIADVEAFRKELPGLYELAKIVRGKPVKGIHMPKLPNSEPYDERYIFSLFGMLGLPLVPANEIDEQAGSAIFPVQSLKEPGFSGKLQKMLDSGKPVVITDGLAKRLSNQGLLNNENLMVLKVQGAPKDLLKLTRENLKPLRDKLMAPMGLKFDAPNKVALYLFGDNYFVVENFNDEPVDVVLDFKNISKVRKILLLPEDGTADLSQKINSVSINNLSPRTLVTVEYKQ
jgi:hypothetical protein